MPKTRNAAVDNVAIAFRAAERTAAQSAIDALRCLATMLEERGNARVRPDTGADVLALMAEGARLSFEAQQRMTAAHPLLAAIPAQIGMASYFGPSEDCPPNQPMGEIMPLRSVA